MLATGATETCTGFFSSAPASLWHGGREEQILPLRRQFLGDAADRNDEAQIQHVVGFIEHQDFGLVEPDMALAEQIEQPARRGHHHVHALLHGLDLAALGHAAEDHGHAQAGLAAISAKALGDLAGQFARRCQHQAAARGALIGAAIGHQAVDDGQGEGRGLAGAGLGDAQQIGAAHDVRDGLGLDGGRGRVFGAYKRRQDRRREAERSKI